MIEYKSTIKPMHKMTRARKVVSLVVFSQCTEKMFHIWAWILFHLIEGMDEPTGERTTISYRTVKPV